MAETPLYTESGHFKDGIADLAAGTMGCFLSEFLCMAETPLYTESGHFKDGIADLAAGTMELYQTGIKCFSATLRLDGLRGLYAGFSYCFLGCLSRAGKLCEYWLLFLYFSPSVTFRGYHPFSSRFMCIMYKINAKLGICKILVEILYCNDNGLLERHESNISTLLAEAIFREGSRWLILYTMNWGRSDSL
ncbi:unnamed protein product [Gongylonema pulchrum]|uniref:Alpha-methylacyl-CoA racemase n=1 Tax=Gongylonema pulchrum TaxID=637853 RepID=A0A183EMP1_9BILA|nr:unnamed protein product [Gongylonema pulchrum]